MRPATPLPTVLCAAKPSGTAASCAASALSVRGATPVSTGSSFQAPVMPFHAPPNGAWPGSTGFSLARACAASSDANSALVRCSRPSAGITPSATRRSAYRAATGFAARTRR